MVRVWCLVFKCKLLCGFVNSATIWCAFLVAPSLYFSNGMCNHIHIESSSIHVLIKHCRFAIIDVHNSQFVVLRFDLFCVHPGWCERSCIAKCQLVQGSGSILCKNSSAYLTWKEAFGSPSPKNRNHSSGESACLVWSYQNDTRSFDPLQGMSVL